MEKFKKKILVHNENLTVCWRDQTKNGKTASSVGIVAGIESRLISPRIVS